jgi:hypothetical protein
MARNEPGMTPKNERLNVVGADGEPGKDIASISFLEPLTPFSSVG